MKISFHSKLNLDQTHQIALEKLSDRINPNAMSFPALFTRFRLQMLERIAATISSDPHVLTRIKVNANTLGFHVPIHHHNDPYKNHRLLNSTIVNLLQTGYILEERPFNFIIKLTEQIKTALAFYGYQGESRTEASAHQDASSSTMAQSTYSPEECSRFRNYLCLLFGPQHDAHLFVIDSNHQVIDCNLHFVRKLIWLNLIEWGYLDHPKEWIDTLLHHPSSLSGEAIKGFFDHPEDLMQCLCAFPLFSKENARALIFSYLHHCLPIDPLEHAQHIYKIITRMIYYKSHSIMVLMNIIKANYSTELDYFISNIITTDLLDNYPKIIKYGIRLIADYPEQVQTRILLQYHYVLSRAIAHTPNQIPSLLKCFSLLSVEQQISIFLSISDNQENLLQQALKQQGLATLKLFIDILTSIQARVHPDYFYHILANVDVDGYHILTLMVEKYSTSLPQPRQGDASLVLTNRLNTIQHNLILYIDDMFTKKGPSKERPAQATWSDIFSCLISWLNLLPQQQISEICAKRAHVSQKNLTTTLIANPQWLDRLNFFPEEIIPMSRKRPAQQLTLSATPSTLFNVPSKRRFVASEDETSANTLA